MEKSNVLPEKGSSKVFVKVVAIVAAVILFVILGVFILLSVVNKKPVAAFYGISEKTRIVISANLQKTVSRKDKKDPYKIVVLDDSKSLQDAMKAEGKIDILFVKNGLNAEYAYQLSKDKNLGFVKDEVLSGMTSSVRMTTTDYKEKKYVDVSKLDPNTPEEELAKITEENRKHLKISSVPILLDNYEIDVKYSQFQNSGIKSINYWSDIEKLSDFNKKTLSAPLIFAGGDDRELLNFVGALTEAYGGYGAWKKSVDKIKEATYSQKRVKPALVNAADEIVSEGGELYQAVTIIKKWKENGWMMNQALKLTKRDVQAYASAGETGIIFMNLEEHRAFNEKIIRDYKTIYYPSMVSELNRNFTAPLIMAVSLSKNEKSRASIKLLARNYQEKLSFQTGLAPVIANCQIPDKQADDVRYWIAATNEPLPTLSDAAFVTDVQRAAFANAIRAALE